MSVVVFEIVKTCAFVCTTAASFSRTDVNVCGDGDTPTTGATPVPRTLNVNRMFDVFALSTTLTSHSRSPRVVGATWYDAQKNVVSSRHGDRITVYAPGDPSHDLTGTSLPELYTNFFGGSSGAVAKVGGAVALMLEADNLLTPAQIKDLLRQSETEVVRITPNGEEVKAGVLLDCEYSISNYRCDPRQEQESVLTKSSAVV